MTLLPTIAPATAADRRWDAIVIGAGPAGAFAASQLARGGLKTLLLEAKEFPRGKVCGGCLNQHGRRVLEEHGLCRDLTSTGAVELRAIRFVCGGRDRQWPCGGSIALRRDSFDALLVETAIQSGAEFLSGAPARVPEEPADQVRWVEFSGMPGHVHRTAAKIVICADGLSHPSVAEHADLASQVHAASRVGVQALVSATAADYPGGVLTMMGGLGGYLGVTAVDGNSLNLAAAIDPRRLSRHYGPCDAVTDLLTENGLPVPGGLAEARWTGTPALSRKSRRASLRRLFLIGDAAGYVEPFTGEGMSWALASALAVSPLATSAAREWTDDLGRVWTGVLKQKVFRQQWMCHLLSRLLRRPRLATAALETCHALPWLRNWALRQAGVSPC